MVRRTESPSTKLGLLSCIPRLYRIRFLFLKQQQQNCHNGYDSFLQIIIFTCSYSNIHISGVYIIKIIDIFAPLPFFQKSYFFPQYSKNYLFSLFFSTSYPLCSRFFIINIIIFPKPTKISYFCPPDIFSKLSLSIWKF